MDIEDIVDGIVGKLAGPGRDEDKMNRDERALMLAQSFDNRPREENFTGFVSQASPKERLHTVAAYREVGATEYANICAHFIVVNGVGFSVQPMLTPGSPDFEYSEDYDKSFSDVRDASEGAAETAYVASILTAHVRKTGLGVA